MWIVLAATVSLATWYTQAKKAAFHVELAEPRDLGFMTIRLPAKWSITNGSSPVVVEAAEPTRRGPGHKITITRERTATLLSPREYLNRSKRYDRIDPELIRMKIDDGPIDFAGWPGYLFVGMRDISGVPLEIMEEMGIGPPLGIFACTVLPSNQAITVSIEGPMNALGDREKELLHQIIQSIQIKDDPPLPGQEKIPLADFGTFDAPPQFSLVQNADSNRQSARLLNTSPEAWAAIELIPCILPTSRSDAASILSMLSLHDAEWLRGRVQQVKQDEWRVDANDTREHSAYALRAYLRTTPEGPALLAIARSQRPDPAPLERAWESIQETLKFQSSDKLARMFDAGADQVKRFRETGLQDLVGSQRAEQWWIWSSDQPEHFLGWSRVWFDEGASWSLTAHSRWREAERRIAGAVQRWKSDDDLRAFSYELVRSDARAPLEDALKPTYGQMTLLRPPGRLQTKLNVGKSTVNPEIIQAPPNFISGAWLTWLLGKTVNEPMIIATEAVPGFEGAIALRPTLLTVETTNQHPRNDDAGKPMRCVQVAVNGTGHVQRWYYSADGSLQSISLPGGQHREPTTREQIKFNMNDDPRLAP